MNMSSAKARHAFGLPIGDSNWKITFLLISVFLGNVVESRHTKYHKYHHIKPTDVRHASPWSGYDTGVNKAERIVQGTPAGAHEFTSYAGLFRTNTLAFLVSCGATLISKRLALTAAHCVTEEQVTEPPSAFALIVGENDQLKINSTGTARIYQIKKFVPHPDFISKIDFASTKDIAIIETSEEMSFDRKVAPACLPYKYFAPLVGQRVTLVGMGATTCPGFSSDVLLKSSAIIHSPLSCGPANIYVEPFSEEEVLCTIGRDGRGASHGDSGGPVYYKDPETDAVVLIGVITNTVGCTSRTINIALHSYLEWIEDHYPGETFCGK